MNLTTRPGRALRAAVAAIGIALLAACGGSTQRVNPFKPTRMLSFGDEGSAITSDGRQYTVNAVDSTTGLVVCQTNPNWVVFLATQVGLVFPECNPGAVALPPSRLFAAPGAKVADLQVQVDAHLGTGAFTDDDLVTMLIGVNDVLEQYALFSGSYTGDSAQRQALRAPLTAVLEARGADLAGQVNRVANLGAKVIVSTIPDLGLTPFAIAEEAASPGRARLLTDLSTDFNTRMRVTIENDGRKIGLVTADDLTRRVANGSNNFTDFKRAACAVALPNCTTATLVSGGDARLWFWADALNLSAGAHEDLGQEAETLVRINPF